ncbi:MAG: hypothetical protein RL701_6584 [Pseudomonadota bacterium]
MIRSFDLYRPGSRTHVLAPLALTALTVCLSAAVPSKSHAQANDPAATPALEPAPNVGPTPPPPLPLDAPPPAAPPVLLSAPSEATPVPPPPVDPSHLVLPGPASDADRARLDYSDGTFYLRGFNDNLVLTTSGRLHIDTYTFAGKGVEAYHRSNGTGLKTNMFFRRFVLEMGGLVRKQWFFWLGGNFAPTSIDANQASVSTANVYDAFIGYMPVPNVRIYFGQYNAPLTMENVTSSRWLDMMERALVVRTVATPYNKADGLMVWGDTESKAFEYQIGVFGGDGQNRPNIDDAFDGMARLVVRPLASRSDASNRLQIGVSGRYGWRDKNFIRYDAPNLSTPGGYTFWSSTYSHNTGMTDAAGKSITSDVHIQPDRDQSVLAAELYLPLETIDLRGEFVYVNEGRREVGADRATTVRTGRFKGFGAYGQVSWWVAGTPRISGNPAGFYGTLKVAEGLGKQADYAVQLVARAELMRLHYDANSRGGDGSGDGKDSATDDIQVNAYQLALNYWATKHIRVSAEYSLYQFPGTPGKENEAQAPGAKRDAHVLHEMSFRLGLAL